MVPLNDVRHSDYRGALLYIEQNKDLLYSSHDSVLYNLDTGVLRHFAGDYNDSTKNLSDAEKLIYTNYTKSVTQEISSFIVNDTMIDYPGEDYEDIYSNLFMSLNYYHQNNLDDALVEINRFKNKVQAISSRHDQELVRSRQAANEKNGAAASIQFHNSALGQYLSLLYHRATNDMDAANADCHMIHDSFLTQGALYPFAEPRTVDEELSIPKEKGRLNILAFSGLAPVKIENRVNFSYDYIFAVPVMVLQPSTVGSISVTVAKDDGTVVASELLEQIESIENIAVETFALRAQVLYNKAIARCLIKGTTAVATRAIGDELANSKDDSTAAIGEMIRLFSVVSSVSNQITEQADLRTSKYFPARADVCGITLDPGTYTVTVTFFAKNKSIITQSVYHAVDVQPQKLSLVEADCVGTR